MAINDYSTLQSAVASWLARADLTAYIPDFITLAEVRISRDLKHPTMLTTVTGTATAGLIALPANFLSPVRLSVNFGGTDMELEPLASAQAINDRFGSLARGFAVEGTNMRVVGGAGDDAYTLTYYAKPAALSAGANWLILSAPDLYLYATLMEATPFIQDDQRMTVWAAAYTRALESLQQVANDARFTPSARVRVDFRTP